MIRVRRSYLEEYRRASRTDWGDEAALIRTIKGDPDPPNWKMEAGTAWHACLEQPSKHYDFEADRHSSGAYWFDADAVWSASRILGPGFWEVERSLVYPTSVGPVEVSCTADHIRGLTIRDNKTKFSTPDPRDYEDSLQWRFYLDVHRRTEFRYYLWHFKDATDDGYCEFKDYIDFSFWSFPGLHDECAGWVEEFARWADACGLLPFLSTGARGLTDGKLAHGVA